MNGNNVTFSKLDLKQGLGEVHQGFPVAPQPQVEGNYIEKVSESKYFCGELCVEDTLENVWGGRRMGTLLLIVSTDFMEISCHDHGFVVQASECPISRLGAPST